MLRVVIYSVHRKMFLFNILSVFKHKKTMFPIEWDINITVPLDRLFPLNQEPEPPKIHLEKECDHVHSSTHIQGTRTTL